MTKGRATAQDAAVIATATPPQAGADATATAPRGGRPILLNDPVALRALAHPARQRLVGELFSGNVLTATQAAEMVGLTPSAVSHHLRALQKYGLAERAEATPDGRERPWRATGSDLSLTFPEDSGQRDVLRLVTGTALATAGEELNAFLDGRVGEDWTGYRGLTRQELWLSQEETLAFSDAIQVVFDRYSAGRHAGSHPPGTRRTGLTVMFLPLELAPGGDGSTAAEEPGPADHSHERSGPGDRDDEQR